MEELFSGILRMSGAGSLAILLVLLVRLGLRKAPKVFSYSLWAIVLFRLLCPVAVPIAIPERSIPVPDSVVAELPQELPDAPEPPAFHRPLEGEVNREVVELPAAPEHRTVNIRSVLSVLWLTGATCLVLTGLISNLRFRHALRESMPIGNRIYIADHIGSAFVIGFLIPSIYLDSSITGKERTYILEHEKTHIRHLDHITRNLAYLALCLHWFNPLVWLAFHLSARDMEMCCDESVIRKLGPQIRGEYSKSLLGLAAGQHLIPAVAFGEGNTRSRVMNLVNWKQASKRMTALGCTLCILVSALCACQPAPEKDVVTSKNDGAFQQSIQESQSDIDSIPSVHKQEKFQSSDGSVEFTWNVDFQSENTTFPVVETSPYFIQGSDAQRITSVLFGDTIFYGVDPETKHQYSRNELQKKIQILSPFANEESLVALMGDEADLEQLQIRLNQYNMQLESAPDENPHAICDWALHKDSYYWDGLHSSQAYGMDALIATAQIDGRDYMVSLMNHDGDDYQDSSIEVKIGDGMPDTYLENRLQRIELCRTKKPTQGQVNRAAEKAMNYVNQMELGEYLLSEVYVSKEVQDDDLYSIVVDAVPAYEGSRVIRGASNQRIIPMDNYDSEYAMTKVRFEFNANAELLYFSMVGLTKEEAMINNNTKTLPIDDIIAKAQNHLSLYDAEAMDIFTADAMFLEFTTGRSRDSLDCKVTITGMDYGLGRIQKADSDNLYYVPAVMLEGTIDWYDKASGELVTGTGLSNRGGKRVRTLVMINAVDGTII